MTKIKIDLDKCIGCGTCVALCSDCFEIKDAKAFVKECNNSCGEYDLGEVAESCPVEAISVEE